MEKIEYKVTKENNTIGRQCKGYLVEKITTFENGEEEVLRRYFWKGIDFRQNINEVDFNKILFLRPITHEEWKSLSPEYRNAWCIGKLTDELSQELINLRKEREVA